MAAIPALEALTAIGASRKGEVALSVTRSEAGPDVAVDDDRTDVATTPKTRSTTSSGGKP
mgnify:CR=1 FL=1